MLVHHLETFRRASFLFVTMAEIPPDILSQLLPDNSLSVHDFLKLPVLIISPTNPTELKLSIGAPTTDDTSTILSLPIPPESFVLQLTTRINQSLHQSVAYPYIPSAQGERFPVWILMYWKAIYHILTARRRWEAARVGLEELAPAAARLVEQVHDALGCIPWSGHLNGFKFRSSIDTLAHYATDKWLGDEHETQLMELLEQELEEGQTRVVVADVFFTSMLERASQDPDGYLEEKDYRWLYKLGQKLMLGDHEQLAVITNIGGNHWVALVIDFVKEEVLYGDSMGHVIDPNLCRTVDWWTHIHTGHMFHHRRLPISHQRDGFSCGIMAWNALRTYFQPNCQLLNPKLAREERLNIMLAIIHQHHNKVSFRII